MFWWWSAQVCNGQMSTGTFLMIMAFGQTYQLVSGIGICHYLIWSIEKIVIFFSLRAHFGLEKSINEIFPCDKITVAEGDRKTSPKSSCGFFQIWFDDHRWTMWVRPKHKFDAANESCFLNLFKNWYCSIVPWPMLATAQSFSVF